MSGTIQRIVGPTSLTASSATLYTVPSGQKIVVRGIHASNGDAGASHNLTISIGNDAAATGASMMRFR